MSNWHPDLPYNALPPLPPAAEVETRQLGTPSLTHSYVELVNDFG
jgi:hypothetical protein